MSLTTWMNTLIVMNLSCKGGGNVKERIKRKIQRIKKKTADSLAAILKLISNNFEDVLFITSFFCIEIAMFKYVSVFAGLITTSIITFASGVVVSKAKGGEK